jgi:YfiH family protein
MKSKAKPLTQRSFRAKAGKSVISYGFSTRNAGYPDFYSVLEKEAPLTIPDQTHSANIHNPGVGRTNASAKVSRSAVANCDALIAAGSGQTLTVRTADCLPVFIWEKSGKAVAIVHAGWKGTHQRIVAKTVGRLKRLGADPSQLQVVFGPAIRSCCYEVGHEFGGRFPAQTLKAKSNGRLRFDLVLANRLQLEAAGVPPANMRDMKLCTACDTKTFYSFRRDPANTGRMIHWIRRD